MAVEPVARDLAVGEEPDQREIAERLADQPGLDPGLAEQRGAAGDAADIDPGLRRARQPALELAQHAAEIGAGAVGIAAAEHDLVARRDLGARARSSPAAGRSPSGCARDNRRCRSRAPADRRRSARRDGAGPSPAPGRYRRRRPPARAGRRSPSRRCRAPRRCGAPGRSASSPASARSRPRSRARAAGRPCRPCRTRRH